MPSSSANTKRLFDFDINNLYNNKKYEKGIKNFIMLTVNYVDNDDELLRIYDRAGVAGSNTSGINAVLFDDDEGIGVCKMTLRDEGVLIVSFDVAKDKAEDPSVSDFFFRTILFKLSMTDVTILCEPDERLEKFGFKMRGDLMAVSARDVVFPSTCGGNH